MKNYALISVSEKASLESMARALKAKGFDLLATGTTKKFLEEKGFDCEDVAKLTGEPERFGGRVKTLHHKIFGALLLRPGKDEAEWPFDYRIGAVVCNFYPFELKGTKAETYAEMIEWIDIGGPSLVRAAAKNFEHVFVFTHASQYARFIACPEEEHESLKKRFAYEAFLAVEDLDRSIRKEWERRLMVAKFELKYGENPHQKASYEVPRSRVLESRGPSYSYNNLKDAEAALRYLRIYQGPASCVIKHQTLCGAAAGLATANPTEVFNWAWDGDLKSRYGGVVGINFEPTSEIYAELSKRFIEVLVMPKQITNQSEFDLFTEKKPNLKILLYDADFYGSLATFHESFDGLVGHLEQELDIVDSLGSEQDYEKLLRVFGEWCGACSKSNAMVLIDPHNDKGLAVLAGAGQGQPNRIDALELLAIPRAKEYANRMERDLTKFICISDAFLPFADSIEVLAKNGIKQIIEPGGSKADGEVQTKADALGVEVRFEGRRHFWH